MVRKIQKNEYQFKYTDPHLEFDTLQPFSVTSVTNLEINFFVDIEQYWTFLKLQSIPGYLFTWTRVYLFRLLTNSIPIAYHYWTSIYSIINNYWFIDSDN